MGVSNWARERFGEAAEDLGSAVSAAIAEAHDDAVAAQASGRTKKKDPYGHTLKNRQHECLVAAARDLTGAAVFHPKGASFELVRFPATRVVLYPWRYATSGAQPRETARMRASGFRRDLLSTDPPDLQLTLDRHASLTEEEIDREFAEEVDVMSQLRSFSQVVTIGYASSVHALISLGWGDAELVDQERGTVRWQHWEVLPLRPSGGGGRQDLAVGGSGPFGPQGSGPVGLTSSARSPRFDDGPTDDDDFGLRPRDPQMGEPTQEPHPRKQDTGTDPSDVNDDHD